MSIFLVRFPSYVLRRVSQPYLELTDSAKLASQEARESSCLCLHETGVTNLYGSWVFYVGSGYQTQVLKLVGQVISQSLEMYFQRVGGHWVWLASFGGGHSFRSRRTPGSSASTLKNQVTVQPYQWALLTGFGLSNTESWHFPNLTLFEEVSNAFNFLLQS